MRTLIASAVILAALLDCVALMSCDSSKKTDAGSSAGAGATSGPTASLPETYWKLTNVDGRPAIVVEGIREAHMVLRKDGSVSGSSSVNRLVGSYKVEGDSISFGQMAGTMMAGPESLMEQEQAFLKALGSTRRYRIDGETLTLTDASGNVVARFVSVYL